MQGVMTQDFESLKQGFRVKITENQGTSYLIEAWTPQGKATLSVPHDAVDLLETTAAPQEKVDQAIRISQANLEVLRQPKPPTSPTFDFTTTGIKVTCYCGQVQRYIDPKWAMKVFNSNNAINYVISLCSRCRKDK